MFSLDLGNLLVHLKMNDTLFSKSILGVQKSIGNAAKNIQRQTKRLAIAATAYGLASVKAFSSFEEQMAFVSTMLNEQSMRHMPQYTKAVKNMAVEFGESTETISRGLYNILSASVKPAEALGVLEKALTASKAGMTDTATTTYALTGIMNAYGMAAKDVGKISDILFATVKRGQTTFAQLAPVIGRVTSIGASAGVKLEEISAALATITRSGISTDQAVTFLRSSLIALQGKGEDNIKMAKKWGIELSTAGLRAEGLSGMVEKLNELGEEQIKNIFTDIRSRQSLIVLLGKQKEFMYDIDVVTGSAGMTQEAYNKLINTTARSLRQLWQVLKYVTVEVGSRLAQNVKNLTKILVDNKEAIASWAVGIADRVAMVGNIIWDVIALMKTRFNQEFQNVLNILLQGFITFGKVVVNLAFRTGKGMIKAMKAGILGDELGKDELFGRVNKLYEQFIANSIKENEKLAKSLNVTLSPEALKMGGTRVKAPGSDKPFYTGPALVKENTELWDKLTEAVIKKHEGRFVESVFKGFPEDVAAMFGELKTNIVNPEMGEIGKIVDENLGDYQMKKIKRAWAEGWSEIKEGGEKVTGYVKAKMEPFVRMGRFVGLIAPEINKAKAAIDDMNDSLDESNTEIQDMLDALQMELDAIPYINQGYERGNQIIRFRNLLQEKYKNDQDIINIKMAEYLGMLEQLQKAQQGGSFERWVTDAKDLGTALEENAVQGLENLSSALTDFVATGRMEWKRFTSDILRMFLNSIIKMQVAAAAASLFSPEKGIITGFVKNLINPTAAVNAATPGAGGIHGFAEGGVAWEPQLAKVAEKEPEVITPFSKLPQFMSQFQKTQQPKVNVENKLKVVNVYDQEEMLSALQSDSGEKVIMNVLRRKGLI